jgi:hypothetical protein
MAGASKTDLVKFIKDEISETETALAFVVSELEKKTTTQFNRIYQRKKSEYEGVLWALNAVLDLAEPDRVKEEVANEQD